MGDKTQEGLKHAEQYFLEMARGSQEGEDYALAEVCHRAAAKIAELVKQQEEYEYNASCIISTKDKRIAELEAANTLLIAENKGWAERFVRIKALPDKWREEKVHNPTETGKMFSTEIQAFVIRNRWIDQCADELQAATLEQDDE
jgi:hypothetical protein